MYFDLDFAYAEQAPSQHKTAAAPALEWFNHFQRPLYHQANPDGLYLVRDFGDQRMTTIAKKNNGWSTTIGFSEYAYLGPLPEGWKLLTA